MLKGCVDRVGLSPSLVDDIIVGNVLPPGGGATIARMAMLHAGFPEKTSVATVNRQCSSGLQAVASIAAAIQAGHISIGIGNYIFLAIIVSYELYYVLCIMQLYYVLCIM